jgi:hypothetical protein
MGFEERIERIEIQLAEMQGAVAVLLAMEGSTCIGRDKPEKLVELRERIVSTLLASNLRAEAVDGAEAAVASFLVSIKLAQDAAGAAGLSQRREA